MFRKYPEIKPGLVSGDCPICNKYQSQSEINWRGKAFCCHKHLRRYMHSIIREEHDDFELLEE